MGDPRREAVRAEGHALLRRLQGQHAQGDQEDLRAVLGHVRRPAQGSPQEQLHALASKTMIEILPENLANHVEKKCGSLAGTPDFFDVIGQVSWYEPEA